MLLFSHKSMAMFFNSYNNRTEMAESLGQSWTVIGRAASLYTDPFLLFSGMLTSYSLFGRLMKGNPINLKNEYIGRLIRIVPSLAALILFCTYVLPLMGSGPQWNLVVGHHSDLCKKNWWRNLLFIHNYFGFGEMVRFILLPWKVFIVDILFNPVSNSHPSPRNRYRTVCSSSNHDSVTLEMA